MLVRISQIRDRVRALCDLPTLTSQTSPTNATMLDLIQTSCSQFAGFVRSTADGSLHFVESVNLQTVSNFSRISLPTDCQSVTRLSWMKDGSNEVQLKLADIESMTNVPSMSWDSKIPTYKILGQTIEFYPTPTAEYDIRLYYSGSLAPQTYDSYIWCMDGWDQYITLQTCIYVRMRQQKKADDFQASLAQVAAQITKQLRRDINFSTIRDVRSNAIYDHISDRRYLWPF